MEQKLNTPGLSFLEALAEFYTWFMSCIKDPISHSGVFRSLSILMRIASHSLKGGHYLSFTLEDMGLKVLSSLKEELVVGTLKQGEVLTKLRKLIEDLTLSSVKAELVLYLTEIEYECCIYQKQSTQSQKLQEYLTWIVHRITPTFLEIKAQAIIQIIKKTLSSPKPPFFELEQNLQDEINKWISQEEC